MENGYIRATDYDIQGIISFAVRNRIDITPDTEKEWAMMANAFRKLGLSESSFVECSMIHGTTEKASRDKYRNAKRAYHTTEQAIIKILYFAKRAGIKTTDFLPDEVKHNPQPYTRPSAEQKRVDEVLNVLRCDPQPQPQNHSEGKQYLDPKTLSQVEGLREKTALYKFMLSEFGSEVDSSFVAYHVGGCKWIPRGYYSTDLCTAFPLIDREGNICDYQLSAFNPDGHGTTDPTDPKRKLKSWALARMGKSETRVKWCFFGEHLLTARPSARVGVVEAPKTALIASIVYPDFVWLACLSREYLGSAVSVEPLRGREVWLFPDREPESVKSWSRKANKFSAQGLNVGVSNYLTQNEGEPHDDLADIILRQRHSQPRPTTSTERISPDRAEAIQAWEQLKRECPKWAELETILDLEPISVNFYN